MLLLQVKQARNQYSDKFWSFKDVGFPFLHNVGVLLSTDYSLHIFGIDHWKMQKTDVFELAAPLTIYRTKLTMKSI